MGWACLRGLDGIGLSEGLTLGGVSKSKYTCMTSGLPSSMHMGAAAFASYVHWVCVQACITKNPKDRPSAEELLHHDWLVRQLEAETASIPEVRPYRSDFDTNHSTTSCCFQCDS